MYRCLCALILGCIFAYVTQAQVCVNGVCEIPPQFESIRTEPIVIPAGETYPETMLTGHQSTVVQSAPVQACAPVATQATTTVMTQSTTTVTRSGPVRGLLARMCARRTARKAARFGRRCR